MNRTESFDEYISRHMKNIEFAQSYFLGLIEGKEHYTIEEALKMCIQSWGIKEFSHKSKVPASNIVDFIKGRRKLKPETLNQYLKPFKLKVKLTVEKAS